MIDRKYSSLTMSLLQKTKNHEVYWQPTSSANSFIVTVDLISVVIAFGNDEHDSGWVSIALRNSDGKVIDHFVVEEGEAEYPQASELFNLARRVAYNVDAVVDDLLKKLSGDGPVGDPF